MVHVRSIYEGYPVARRKESLAGPDEVMLIRPGSAKAIAEAVKALRADASLGPALVAKTRARVERDFPWGRAQEALVRAYEETFGMARAHAAMHGSARGQLTEGACEVRQTRG